MCRHTSREVTAMPPSPFTGRTKEWQCLVHSPCAANIRCNKVRTCVVRYPKTLIKFFDMVFVKWKSDVPQCEQNLWMTRSAKVFVGRGFCEERGCQHESFRSRGLRETPPTKGDAAQVRQPSIQGRLHDIYWIFAVHLTGGIVQS